MGQIERYGLFVLSLVIFFILGIAIWGPDTPTGNLTDPEGAAPRSTQAPLKTEEENAAALRKALDHQFQQGSERQSEAERSLEDVILGDGGGSTDEPKRQPVLPKKDPVDPGPVTPGPKPAAEFALYKVRRGDTLGHIAQRMLGSAQKYKLIEKFNPQYKNKTLPRNAVLKIPRELVVKHGGLVASGRKYTVKKGDNLWAIAKKRVGARRATAYAKKIQRLNNIPSGDLDVGMVLAMPAIR